MGPHHLSEPDCGDPSRHPAAPINTPNLQRRRQASEVRSFEGPHLGQSQGGRTQTSLPLTWRAKVVGDGAWLGFRVKHSWVQILAPTQTL